MDTNVIKRDISDEIQQYLGTDNIIVLHGARQVGKTHILYYLKDILDKQGNSTYYFDLEDSRLLDLLNSGIDNIIAYLAQEGYVMNNLQEKNQKMYVFIDEIQYLEDPSPLLKLLQDHTKTIQLIVSGSSSFDIKSKFSDSLVGRTVNFEIYPLSFHEFLRFKGIPYDTSSLSTIHQDRVKTLFKEYMLYGGYPKIVLEQDLTKKEKYLQQIIDTYVRKDIRDLAKIKDVQKFNSLLKLLASQSGQLLNVTELAETVRLARDTVEGYLFILENTYVIKLVTPFSSSASIEVIKNPKIFFYDTGILQMLWLRGLHNQVLGNIFETCIFSELVKKYGVENISYWRTKKQHEIDFILTRNNTLLPIEVKTSFRTFDTSSLNFFMEKYHTPDYQIVSLEGEKQNQNSLYPWEL